MADESTEHRDSSPGPLGQPPRDGETNKAGRDSNRRRIIITSLLTPPAVMTRGRGRGERRNPFDEKSRQIS